MAEEIRFFVRVALFAAVLGTIYWFRSYDAPGTILFAGVVAGAAFFAVLFAMVVPETREDPEREAPHRSLPRRLVRRVDRALGFAESSDGSSRGPLTVSEEPLVPASVWPLAASLGATLIALGLVYGGWILWPGVALAALAGWGWLRELQRP